MQPADSGTGAPRRGEIVIRDLAKYIFLSLGILSGAGWGGGICHATVAGQLLDMSLDARSLGQGSAYLAVAGSLAGMEYNPAGLSLLPGSEARASYRRDVLDVYFESLACGLPAGPGKVLGLGIYRLYGGKMEDEHQTITAQEDVLVSAAFAWDFQYLHGGWKYPLAAGVTVKYLYSSLAEIYKSATFAADAGVYAQLPWENISVGVAVKNLGQPIRYLKTNEGTPWNIGCGASWKKDLSPAFRVGLSADGNQTAGSAFASQIGTEINYCQLLFLRGGYHIGHDTDSFTFGLGLQTGEASLDYAFIKNALADKHVLTLGYSFGPRSGQAKK